PRLLSTSLLRPLPTSTLFPYTTLFRSVGNRSGRGRCRPDGTPRAGHPPRAVPLSTGEDIPAGQSLRARMIALEVERGDIDAAARSEEHTSELQSQSNLVCRLLLEKKKT